MSSTPDFIRPASEDPYYIDSVPMYYDFAHDHDNTIGDRFFDMPGQAFDSSPVAYERVRTPLAEVNGASATNASRDTQPVPEPPRHRRVSKTNMVEEFSKEIQKRRSINAEPVPKGVAAPLRPSGGVPPPSLKNATAHSSSVFKKTTNKSINPTVIGTIGIKTTPLSQRVAPLDTANSPMRLRSKRNSSLDKERSKEKVAAKTKEAESHGSKETASSEPIFKPLCPTNKKATPAAGVARPPPLQRRSISSVVAGGATMKMAPVAPSPKAVDSKINRGHTKQAAPKSIFSSQNKPAVKKPASTISSGTTFAMRLRSSTKETAEKAEDSAAAGFNAYDDKADTASNKSEDGKARRFSHYMAPTIASRRRSNVGLALKVAK